MNHSFERFDVQLMVGVGGSRNRDAPIASVVASDRVYWVRSAKHTPERVSSRPRALRGYRSSRNRQ